MPGDDLAPIFAIRFSSHRIINPLDDGKLAALGAGLHLSPEQRLLDLACGTGELLTTWSRDHGVSGHGVDLSSVFVARARDRAEQLGVADRVTFEQRDASDYIADEKADVGGCLGADWIGGGTEGTVALLERNVVPGGLILLGQPFWQELPPNDEIARACGQASLGIYLELPDLLTNFRGLGFDLVEMVCADQDSWDRYTAAQWWNIRQWLDHDDASGSSEDLIAALQEELSAGPSRYARYRRRYLGWGVFALRSH